MKYLLPLFLISFCVLAIEPPVVKSKAAQELLKHPEFKKAMEAAPELGKLLEELDKHAPAAAKKLTLNGVVSWQSNRLTDGTKRAVKLPQYNALDFDKEKIATQLAEFYSGWTLEKWKSSFGKPDSFTSRKTRGGRQYYWCTPAPRDGHELLFNSVTEKGKGVVWWHFDKNFKIERIIVYFTGYGSTPIDRLTPYGKKMGYE